MTSPVVHIIDDDEAVRDSLATLLEVHGLSVRTYASAPAFLSALDAGVDGCVITDVQMPQMNGLELLKAMAARGVARPVIVITARAGRALADQAMALGAYRMFEKPFDPDALIAAIRQALA